MTQESGSQSKRKTDPKKAKGSVQWKHDAPLISCRFDPTGEFPVHGLRESHDRALARGIR